MARIQILPRYNEKAAQAKLTVQRQWTQLVTRHGLMKVVLGIFALFTLSVFFTEYILMSLGAHSIVPKPLFLQTKPVVTIPQGIYEGTSMRGEFPQVVEMFLGIPYAKDTSGAGRFKPPVRVEDSTNTYQATSYGNRCPSSGDKDVPEGEDCLSVNIYRPMDRPEDEKLPVAIFFHGGSFNFGVGRQRAMSSMVAWSTKPFIGISFNYRVGAFGFLPSTMMKEEGGLNIGLKDQLMLLQWVQDNIEAFGGNPGEVTAMGASAGAHSIGHHLLRNFKANGLRQLFHKVIMESGGPLARSVYPYNHTMHEQQFKEFLDTAGVGAMTDRKEIMEYLRNLPAKDIKHASETIYNKYHASLRWPFQPVIDGPGGMIPIKPIEVLRKGKWNSLPMITGFNTDEGTGFVPKNMDTSEEFNDFFRTLLPQLNETEIEELNRLYPDPNIHGEKSKYFNKIEGTGRQFKRVAAAYGQYAYIAPVRLMAKMAHFKKNLDPRAVHYYEFDVKQSIIGGSAHGAQEDYVTYSPRPVNGPFHSKEIAGVVHAYWTSYIVTGVEDPSADRIHVPDHWDNRRNWGQFGLKGSSNKMLFGQGNDEMAGGNDWGFPAQQTADKWAIKECTFWWNRIDMFES